MYVVYACMDPGENLFKHRALTLTFLTVLPDSILVCHSIGDIALLLHKSSGFVRLSLSRLLRFRRLSMLTYFELISIGYQCYCSGRSLHIVLALVGVDSLVGFSECLASRAKWDLAYYRYHLR